MKMYKDSTINVGCDHLNDFDEQPLVQVEFRLEYKILLYKYIQLDWKSL
jgi:hypothetical protein